MHSQVRQIITIYCFCDDFLQAWGHKDAPQAKRTTAQVMTIALVAVTLFDGNQERSRCFLKEHGDLQPMLSKGCFNRRLHEVPEALWQALFEFLAGVHKQNNEEQLYAVDSLPVAVDSLPVAVDSLPVAVDSLPVAVDSLPVAACDNYRICRSRLYPRRKHGEAFRGYIACKKRSFSGAPSQALLLRRSFYGLRVHLLMTTAGLPVEVMLAPASQADIRAFRRLPLALPPDAYIFADAGYLDQHEEALLKEAAEVHLVAQRRAKTKTPLAPWLSYVARRKRKYIETVFSQIAAALGRTVHAVTPRGFELKVFLTVLAFTLTAGL